MDGFFFIKLYQYVLGIKDINNEYTYDSSRLVTRCNHLIHTTKDEACLMLYTQKFIPVVLKSGLKIDTQYKIFFFRVLGPPNEKNENFYT